jgi:hypothetical protein
MRARVSPIMAGFESYVRTTREALALYLFTPIKASTKARTAAKRLAGSPAPDRDVGTHR